MSKSKSDQELVKQFKETSPDDAGLAELMAQLEKRFPRMLAEDQLQAAERLAELRDREGVLEVIRRLYDAPGAGLAALIELAKPRADVDPALIKDMETWLGLCEDDQRECDPFDFFGLPEKIQAAILDHLALWLRADLLSELLEAAPDKDQLKPIKKAIHRVKSQGVEIAGKELHGPTLIAEERDEYVDEAHLTPPDASGTMFINLYRTVFGKNQLYVILLNDRGGVIFFEGHEVPVPRFKRILESTRQNPNAILIKSDPAFARRLIKQAEDAGLKNGQTQNREFLGSRRLLGIADLEPAPHPIWGRLDKEELKKEHGLAARSQELLEHRLFERWRLEPLTEGKFMVELSQILTSPIALTEAQIEERKHQLYEKEARLVLDDAGRETWRDRLLTCALVLDEIGDKDPARMTAALALALEDPERPIPPFFVELLEKTVALENADDDEDPESPDQSPGGMVTA